MVNALSRMSQAQRAVHAEELARAGADRAAATAEAQLDAVKENHDAERKGLQVCVGVRVRFIVAASDLHPTHPHQPTHSAQGEIEQLTASLRAAEADAERARADEMSAAAELDRRPRRRAEGRRAARPAEAREQDGGARLPGAAHRGQRRARRP